MQRRKLWWIAAYALSMAYVESAVVVYLRDLYGITDLMCDVPPYDERTALIEIGRELATLVMLLAVGCAVGRSSQARVGFTSFAFGLWDIWYYVWLKVLTGWPESLLTQDVLFLIPLPWWGPVITPMLIAALAVAGGAQAVVNDDQGRALILRPLDWITLLAGLAAVLYAFMAAALLALPATAEDLSRLRPSTFNWPVYLLGLAGLTWFVFRTTWRAAPRR